jgi:D-alanyl-D-alanine endopeptidase (penicillin-binding protein 7)
LFSDNVSSALDMAKLIAFASSDARIAPIMQKSNYTLATSRRTITVHNTNRLVGSEVAVQGGKTGFIRSAGYCLATMLKLPQGDPVAVVVLGPGRTPGVSWKPSTCSTGSPARPRRCSARLLPAGPTDRQRTIPVVWRRSASP